MLVTSAAFARIHLAIGSQYQTEEGWFLSDIPITSPAFSESITKIRPPIPVLPKQREEGWTA